MKCLSYLSHPPRSPVQEAYPHYPLKGGVGVPTPHAYATQPGSDYHTLTFTVWEWVGYSTLTFYCTRYAGVYQDHLILHMRLDNVDLVKVET